MPQEREFQHWKNKKTKLKILPAFEPVREFIKLVASSQECPALLLVGEGGIGKTAMVLQIVKQEFKPSEWELLSSYSTPLSIYSFLYEHRNKKVIILDDVEGLFNNELSVSILKGAMWETGGERIVQYHSTSDKLGDLPSRFIITSKLVILCNRIPNNKDVSVRAMVSRAIRYPISFTYQQKLEVCKQIVEGDNALEKKEREQVLKLIKDHTSPATKDVNFRTLLRAKAMVRYNPEKATALFTKTVEEDDALAAYYQVIKVSDKVAKQQQLWSEKTGLSRRSFFRTKRKAERNT